MPTCILNEGSVHCWIQPNMDLKNHGWLLDTWPLEVPLKKVLTERRVYNYRYREAMPTTPRKLHQCFPGTLFWAQPGWPTQAVVWEEQSLPLGLSSIFFRQTKPLPAAASAADGLLEDTKGKRRGQSQQKTLFHSPSLHHSGMLSSQCIENHEFMSLTLSPTSSTKSVAISWSPKPQ